MMIFHSLYNLIPFLRSDGYWILSDMTGITNFHSKSFLQFRTFLKCLFTKRKMLLNKDERILLLYAFTNLSFLIFFIFYSVIFNIKDILYFPYNIYNILISSWDTKSINIQEISMLIIPFTFYFLLISIIKVTIMKRIKNKKNG